MPSPFPGMDPFLEDPGLWPDVHHGIISEAQAQLTGVLRPKYAVRVGERVYVSDDSDPGRTVIVPDIRIAERPGKGPRFSASDESGPVATAEPVVVDTMLEIDVHESRLEIVDRARREVITVIEILSPANKVAGSRGREKYAAKRSELMSSPNHLVEIDLLRAGEPFVTRAILPPCEYAVHVSAKGRRPKGEVWPIRLNQRLPVIPIPLKPEDGSVGLDLQKLLTTAYERAGYDLDVDYRSDPKPPLPPEWAEWADKLLRQRGLRGDAISDV